MNIQKTCDGGKLKIALEGRLDITTAPQLEDELKASLPGTEDLVIDLTELEYVSSAGLRVLLYAQKVMNKQGSMVITHVSPDVMEIFDVTGFVDILNIEE